MHDLTAPDLTRVGVEAGGRSIAGLAVLQQAELLLREAARDARGVLLGGHVAVVEIDLDLAAEEVLLVVVVFLAGVDG